MLKFDAFDHSQFDFTEVCDESAKFLYQALANGRPAGGGLRSQHFLDNQVERVNFLPCDLPSKIDDLEDWACGRTASVGLAYQDYLAGRKSGAARTLFSNKSHALYFLQRVAPTKLVDGSWLYGLLPRWQDQRFQSLIRIYLEELGDGVQEHNHVAVYRKLLAANGCEEKMDLADEYYIQGAIQLALGSNAKHYLPEIIGFNLGYEQLPLHLLITSYELAELGIDPHYFRLHVTIDNADNGHAKKAIHSVTEILPNFSDCAEFYRRVSNGYKLNDVGLSTHAIIESFDMEKEIRELFSRKAKTGKFLHSDRCKIAGRTVNSWLSQSNAMADLLCALEHSGWVKRNENPRSSRFWALIEGEQPKMFGVFNVCERQLIFDWIAGAWEGSEGPRFSENKKPAVKPHLSSLSGCQGQGARPRSSQLGRFASSTFSARIHENKADDFNSELRQFEQKLAGLPNRQALADELIRWMGPTLHATPPGLMATRLFREMQND